jgi:hypothetical protein
MPSVGRRQLRDDFRVPVERPVADDLTGAVVEIHHRGKAEIHARIEHFGGHQPAAGLCKAPSPVIVEIVLVAQPAQGREAIETFRNRYARPPSWSTAISRCASERCDLSTVPQWSRCGNSGRRG